MTKAFCILLSLLIMLPTLSYAYIDPSTTVAAVSLFVYIAIILVLHIVFGLASRSINQSKGYEGGFAWGFWLGIIGIIVVACKANKNAYTTQDVNEPVNSTSTKSISNTTELERLAKLHQSGALSDAEFTEAKQKLISKM